MSQDIRDALPVYPEEQPPPLPPLDKASDSPPHPNFWWGILWCIALLLFTQVPGAAVALVIMLVTYFVSPNLLPLEELKTPESMMGNSIVQFAMAAGLVVAHILIILFSLVLLRVVVGKNWYRAVALRLPSFSHVLLALAMVPAFMILANGAYYVLRYQLGVPSVMELMKLGGMEEIEKSFGAFPLLLGALMIGLLPGLSEELWCRAFLGRGIVGTHGYVLGVLGTSLLFGLIHIDPCQGGMAAILGIILHFSYLMSRSLLIPMLLHFLNNSLAVLLTRAPDFVHQIAPEKQAAPPLVYLSAAFLLAAVCWAFYQSRARLVTVAPLQAWAPPAPGVACPPPDSGTFVHTPLPSFSSVLLVLLAFLSFAGVVVSIWLNGVN